jgi:glycosyltransferase involved in cell wall biosynthesis
VADRLVADGRADRDRIVVVPHPALGYGGAVRAPSDGPLRVLFLGRIMKYKGLPLLVEAIEMLRAKGDPTELGVYGEGDIAGLAPRLAGINAMVVNRWIDHEEIGAILSGYDVMALPYVEASQSGVVAAAHGAGMPVVATPVGGLGEQVLHGIDGLLTDAVTAPALAAAIWSLSRDRGLLRRLTEGAAARRDYTVPVFARRLKDAVLGTAEG